MTYLTEGTYFHAILIFIITTHAVEIIVHQVSVSTAQYKKSTYNTCTLLYNALPDDIKQLKSVYKFKLNVKSFLLQNCFYTIRDYTDREKKNNV